MKPLVRTTPRPGPPKTKVLLVRPAAGIKSVRRSDEADRGPLRLAIGVVSVLGVLLVVWLMGYLGFRLGFAPLIDVPQLQADAGAGLVTGTIMLISVPEVILRAGEANPLWLMVAFALIAIPAAGLGAAKPRTPGGPRPSAAALAFSYAGAVGAGLNTLALVAWIVSPARISRIDQLRVDARETAWLEDLLTVAGLDVLGVIAAALWVVLVMRLAVPLWLRALAGSAAFFALAAMTVAMSMSNAAAAELQKTRSEVFLDDGSLETRLLLGTTPGRIATMRMDHGVAVIELHEVTGRMTVVGRQSVITMMRKEAVERE